MRTSKIFYSLLTMLLVSPAFAAMPVEPNGTGYQNSEEQTRPQVQDGADSDVVNDDNAMDELDPYADDIDATLQKMDVDYENATGLPARIDQILDLNFNPNNFAAGCVRAQCAVWARVNKASQSLTLYVNGQVVGTFATSTGIPGRGTPNFDRHPDGRIYTAYTSKKFPGGDYNGLGNMPYAVFIQGGFAIHGTGRGNWAKLGRVASHGCIRIHPDNAQYFNSLVRTYGVKNTWITVE